MRKKRIAIFGSTGSIGRQTLDVIKHLGGDFEITALVANNNSAEFERQKKEFSPRAVFLSSHSTKGSLEEIATRKDVDIVVMAIVGTPGLKATIEAIKAGKIIAFASKEILVAAGDIVMPLIKKHGATLLPLDSEHSAIFQCLQGNHEKDVKRIILTASGGPFRDLNKVALSKVKAKQALKHPTWNMGPKITIDSATLMNKGLEAIEAHHLFNMPYDKIDVVIHPQSIIHSMVEYVDGSVLAQMNLPDMRLAIQYALTYPERKPGLLASLDFNKIRQLDFKMADMSKFPCLKIAYDCGTVGGFIPAIMSAANDSAVELFLNNKIGFYDIPKIIKNTVDKSQNIRKEKLTLEKLLAVEKWARAYSSALNQI